MSYREILAERGALWCDQYALVMAQALFKSGKHEACTTFHVTIRKTPFDGGYLLTAGQNIFFDWVEKFWRFDEDDLRILKNKVSFNPHTQSQERLFDDPFLEMLEKFKRDLTIDSLPEGELAFADEPIMRITGPVWQCLLVEAAVLNCINAQSLFATLASRLDYISGGAAIYEFGLRRSQGIDGLSSTRGAYVGGVAGTSNMLAQKYYQIPATGTMAHAFVMMFESELEAFEHYACAMPQNGVFLVDTYDSLQGVRHAIQACRKAGTVLKAIRLDSGDLAYLARQARDILDQEGLKETRIIASNDLDEQTIDQIKRVEQAPIDDWGVGTRLATSYRQPALGAVYKLGAVHDEKAYRDVIKLSNQSAKISIPGVLDIVRYLDERGFLNGSTIVSGSAKGLIDSTNKLVSDIVSLHKDDSSRRKVFKAGVNSYAPLMPAFVKGRRIVPSESVHDARKRAKESLARLDPAHRRPLYPHEYVVGLEQSLYEKRKDLIKRFRRVG